MSRSIPNPYESSHKFRTPERRWIVRDIVAILSTYMMFAYTAAWIGTAIYVGAGNVFTIWKMQPLSDHALQASIFFAGAIGSFLAICYFTRSRGVRSHLFISAVSGAAFAAAPYAFEPIIDLVPADIVADAGHKFDTMPIALNALVFFLGTTSSVLLAAWICDALASTKTKTEAR